MAFEDNVVLRDMDLDVPRGEFITMVGPSGCGKSTTLNAISGLLDSVPSARVQGTVRVAEPSQTAYAFQKDALLPWASALRNIEVGAELAGVPRSERRERAEWLLEHVGLFGVGHKYPHQLSGGMRQRVALARALAYNPDLFLLDEPFGALDAFTRMDLQDKLLEIWLESGMTTILVTHDLVEALSLGSRVIVLAANPGRIHTVVDNQEWGYPRKVEDLRQQESFLDKYRYLFTTLVSLSEESRRAEERSR